MYRTRAKTLSEQDQVLNNIYGSTKASKFLQDLASGTDSVDFVVIGDSNTGSSVAGMWGYHNGLQQALNDKGYTCYGTSVFPVLSEINTQSSSTAGSWRSAAVLTQKGATLLSGNDATAQSEASAYYSQFSPIGYIDMTAVNPIYVRYGSSSVSTQVGGPNIESWAYLARNSASYFNSYGMGIDPDHPLSASGNTLYYRLKYGKLLNANNTTVSPAQDGGFCPIVLKTAGSLASAGTEITTRKFVSCAAANAGEVGQVFVEDLQFTTATYTGYRAGWSYVGNGSNKTCGPMVLHCQSMYARRKGWAVTSLCYLGGYNSQNIAAVLNGVKNTSLKALVKEIRERQITAGGSGRVVIMAQSGVNSYSTGLNYETPQRWTDAHKSIWSSFKEIWISLGYPLSDLAIVSWVSHPSSLADGSSGSSLADNLVAVRTAANQMAIENPDMTVVDIKKLIGYNSLVTGNGNGQSLFQYWNNSPIVASDFPAHLSGGTVTTGTSVFAANATFTSTSFTLTGAYATEGTTNNYFSNRQLEIVEVGYVSGGTVSGVTASTGGNFTCSSFTQFAANRPVVVSGTLTGTATITGYSNPTTYYIIGTPTNTSFQLSASYGGAAITTTAGTTTGLTFTVGVQNRQPQLVFITEYDGTTKVAKVRAWPGGTPSNSGGGITPLDVGAAGNKNITYRLNTFHLSDGYTQYMNSMVSSLTTTNL